VSYALSESPKTLEEINMLLAEVRDDLHDATMSGDDAQVVILRKTLETLRQQKRDLLKANNV
jgi:hypothetical protein